MVNTYSAVAAAADPAFDQSNEMNTWMDPTLTYSFSKYSCVVEMFHVHAFFGWVTFLSGLMCFVTRLTPKLQWAHAWFGRLYLIGMIWTIGASLLIYNTGLPQFFIYMFTTGTLGLSVGFLVIKLHDAQLEARALELVQEQVRSSAAPALGLATLIRLAKVKLMRMRSFTERFVSFKTAHGVLMFVSWVVMLGQTVNTRGNYACYAYPVVKPIDTKRFPNASRAGLTLMPTLDPHYGSLPWAYKEDQLGLLLVLGPMTLAAAVGAVWSYRASPRRSSGDGDAKVLDIISPASQP